MLDRRYWPAVLLLVLLAVLAGPSLTAPAHASTPGAFDSCVAGAVTGTGSTAAGSIPVDEHDGWDAFGCGWWQAAGASPLLTASSGSTLPGGYGSAVWLPADTVALLPPVNLSGADLVTVVGWTGDVAGDAGLTLKSQFSPWMPLGHLTFPASGAAATRQAVVCNVPGPLELVAESDSSSSPVIADVSVVPTSPSDCPPITSTDYATVDPAGSATVDVAANDTDASNLPLDPASTVSIAGGRYAGTATATGTTIEYTPAAGEPDGTVDLVRYAICPPGAPGYQCGSGQAMFTVQPQGPRSADAVFFADFENCSPGSGPGYSYYTGADFKLVDSYADWVPGSCGWSISGAGAQLVVLQNPTSTPQRFASGTQAVALNEVPSDSRLERSVTGLQRGRRYTLSAVAGGDDYIMSYPTALDLTAGSTTTSRPLAQYSGDQVLSSDFCAESDVVPISLGEDGTSLASPVVDDIEIDDAGSWCDLAAVPDTLSVPAGTTAGVDVTTNDTLAGSTAGVPVAAVVTTPPSGGAVSVSRGVLSYRAAAGDAGRTVTVPYEVCPPGETATPPCAASTVTVTVTAAPVVTDGGPVAAVGAQPAVTAARGGTGRLAWTGLDVVPVLGLGAGLFGVGIGLVLLGRRRSGSRQPG